MKERASCKEPWEYEAEEPTLGRPVLSKSTQEQTTRRSCPAPQCWRVLLQALGAEGQSQAPRDNGSWGGTYQRARSVGLGRGGSKCSLCLLLAVLLLPLFLRENPKRFVPKTLRDLTPRMSLLGKQDTRTWQNTDFSSFLHTYKASALLDIQESHQDDRNLYFGRKWHLAYKQHEDQDGSWPARVVLAIRDSHTWLCAILLLI